MRYKTEYQILYCYTDVSASVKTSKMMTLCIHRLDTTQVHEKDTMFFIIFRTANICDCVQFTQCLCVEKTMMTKYFFVDVTIPVNTHGVSVINITYPDNKVHEANMGPTWVLSAPDGPHVVPMNLAIWVPAIMYNESAEPPLHLWHECIPYFYVDVII